MVIKYKLKKFNQNMNKKAWIKIVEAFTAIMLVAGVLLIVINQGYVKEQDISSQVYDVEVAILREIQLDENIRTEILSTSDSIEITETTSPLTWNKIEERMPDYLECRAKICEIGNNCEILELPDQDIYVQTVAITAILEVYDPKQLKLACWSK